MISNTPSWSTRNSKLDKLACVPLYILVLSLAQNCGQSKRLKFFSTSQQKSSEKYHHHGELSAISSQGKPQQKLFLYQNMRDNYINNTLNL